MSPDLTNLYYRERDIETKTNIDIERYALSSPEKNLPPVQSRQIHRSQDLGKSPTCSAGWQGGKTWELRHQIWWLSASTLHFAYYLLPKVLGKLVDFMNSLRGLNLNMQYFNQVQS